MSARQLEVRPSITHPVSDLETWERVCLVVETLVLQQQFYHEAIVIKSMTNRELYAKTERLGEKKLAKFLRSFSSEALKTEYNRRRGNGSPAFKKPNPCTISKYQHRFQSMLPGLAKSHPVSGAGPPASDCTQKDICELRPTVTRTAAYLAERSEILKRLIPPYPDPETRARLNNQAAARGGHGARHGNETVPETEKEWWDLASHAISAWAGHIRASLEADQEISPPFHQLNGVAARAYFNSITQSQWTERIESLPNATFRLPERPVRPPQKSRKANLDRPGDR